MAITYVGTGGNTVQATAGAACLVTYPTGLAAGDLLLLDMGASVVTPHATNAATGFTRRLTNTAGGSSPAQAIFYKIATGSESGTISVTSPGGATQGAMYAYRGVDQATPFDVADALFSSAAAPTAYDVPSQTPTMLGVTFHLHAGANAGTGSYTPPTVPTTHVELLDAAGTTPGNWAAHLLDWQSTSATGVRNIVRSVGLRGYAASVALRPAVAATATPRNLTVSNPAVVRATTW